MANHDTALLYASLSGHLVLYASQVRGDPPALNVGLKLADGSVPAVQSALAELHGVSAYEPWARPMASMMGESREEARAVRKMGEVCPAGSVNWLSCLTWDSRRHVASICLPRAELDALRCRLGHPGCVHGRRWTMR